MEQFHSTHGNIAHQVVGSGAPLIMLHGTPFSSVIWQRFLPVLQHKYKVYTYDLLGYGRSEKVGGDVSLGVQNLVLMELLDHWEVEDRYGQISCPTKIIWAREDGWIPIAKGRELQTRIPGAAFAEIPKAGHLAPWDQPERVLGELLSFLEA